MSSKFGFILVKPQIGENIGACARAMKNFGFSKLHIVEPKINFPNHKVKATSVGAYDIINKAKVFDKIEKAIKPFDLVISLSARRRDINKKHISLKEFLKIIKKRKKKIYHKGITNIVGLDIKPELPKKPNLIIKNDFKKRLENLSKKVFLEISKIIRF